MSIKNNIFTVFFGIALIVISILDTIANSDEIIEIKNPIFTTKGIDGNPYEIKAERGFQNKNLLDLFVIEAKLKNNDDFWIYLNAEKGTFDQSKGEINLSGNIVVYSERNEKIYADFAEINTNNKIIILNENVKYQDQNILITAHQSVIDQETSKIIYSGDVNTKILKRTQND